MSPLCVEARHAPRSTERGGEQPRKHRPVLSRSPYPSSGTEPAPGGEGAPSEREPGWEPVPDRCTCREPVAVNVTTGCDSQRPWHAAIQSVRYGGDPHRRKPDIVTCSVQLYPRRAVLSQQVAILTQCWLVLSRRRPVLPTACSFNPETGS